MAQGQVVTHLLVRYAGGFVEANLAGDPLVFGRIESLLSLGSIQDQVQAFGIGATLITDRAAPAVSVAAGFDPSGVGDVPFVDFGVGDWVDAPNENGVTGSVRVESLSVTEDDVGAVSFAPELGTVMQEADAKVQRWLKTMSPGTLAGTVQSVTPPPPPPPTPNPTDDDLIDFHVAGALASWTVAADATPFRRNGTLYHLLLSAAVPPSTTDVVIHILFNGAVLSNGGVPYTPTLHVGETMRESHFWLPVHGGRDPNTDVTPDTIAIVPVTATDPDAAGLHAIFSIKPS